MLIKILVSQDKSAEDRDLFRQFLKTSFMKILISGSSRQVLGRFWFLKTSLGKILVIQNKSHKEVVFQCEFDKDSSSSGRV